METSFYAIPLKFDIVTQKYEADMEKIGRGCEDEEDFDEKLDIKP